MCAGLLLLFIFFLSMCFIVNSCIILILVSGFLPCFPSIVVIVFSFLYFGNNFGLICTKRAVTAEIL